MSIQFSGLGSGIDTSSWVDGLVALKQAKVTTLEESKKATQTIQETLSSIRSFFSTFRSTLERFTDAKFGGSMDLFIQNSAKSMNAAVVTATATSEAARQSYDVLVEKLATATKAESGKTTLDNATGSTKLSQLGMRDGTILIAGKSISVSGSDTISAFVTKLNNAGIDAYFDENKAKLNLDTTFSKISQGITKFTEAFQLNASNVGYSNSVALTTTIKQTAEAVATNDTLLSKLGVTSGKINVTTNGLSYDVEIDAANTKLGDLAGVLGVNAWLDSSGSYTIENAVLKNVDGGSNLVSALGLTSSVYSQTQVSNNLNVTNTVVENPLGTTNLTTLGVTAGKVSVTAGGETTEYEITADTTINSFVSDMNALGAASAYDESTGNLTVNGATFSAIDGGSNVLSVFNFSTNIYSSSLKTEAMTETLTTSSNIVATGDTELKDLGLVGNYSYEIYDKDGNKIGDTQSITGVGSTINTLLGAINTVGSSSGITASISDGVVKIDGGYIVCEEITNALKLSTINAGTSIEGSQTFETTVAVATESSKLSQLGISDTTYTLKSADGTTIASNVEINSATTLGTLAAALTTNGVTAKIENGKLVMEGGYIEGDLAVALEMATTSSSTNSDKTGGVITYNKVTTATVDNTLGNIGIAEDKTYSIYNDDGEVVATGLSATSDMTIAQLVSAINTSGNASGVMASFDESTGSIKIEGGKIDGDLATALGLTATSVNVSSQVTGTNLTYNITNNATGETTLAQLGVNTDQSYVVKDADGNTVNSGTITSATDINTICSTLSGNGVTVSFDEETGKMSVTGGSVTGAIADVFGLTTSDTDVTSSKTGTAVTYDTTSVATSSNTLADLGATADVAFTICDSDGTQLLSSTFSTGTSLSDVICAVSETLGSKGDGIGSATFTDGKLSIEGGYVTGSLATALGFTDSTVGTTGTTNGTLVGGVLTYDTTLVLTSSNTLADLGVNEALTYTIYDSDGTILNCSTFESSTSLSWVTTVISSTLGGEFADSDYMNLGDGEGSATFANSTISIEGGYITGTLAEKLGMTITNSTTSYNLSTNQLTYLEDYYANADTEISKVAASGSFSVYDSDGIFLKEYDLDTSNTLGYLCNLINNDLAAYGDQSGSASINDYGYLSINGGYIVGDLASSIGISLSEHTSYTTSNTMSSDLYASGGSIADTATTLADLGITDAQTITVKDTDGTTLLTSTLASSKTLEDVLACIACPTASVTAGLVNGVLSVGGAYVTGTIADALGFSYIKTESNSVTYETEAIFYGQTGEILIGDSVAATSVTWGELGSTEAITVFDTDGTQLGILHYESGKSLTDIASSIGSIITTSGIQETLADGCTYTVENGLSIGGGYITGFVDLTNIYSTATTGSTIETVLTTTGATSGTLSVEYTSVCSTSTTLAELGATQSLSLMLYDTDGTQLFSSTFDTSETIDSIQTAINEVLTSKGDYCGAMYQPNDGLNLAIWGGYITGTLAEFLGMDLEITSTTTVDSASTYLSYYDPIVVDDATKLVDMGVSTGDNFGFSYNGNSFTYSISTSTTVDDILSYMSDATSGGITYSINNGIITLNSNKAVTISGSAASALGLTGTWDSNTTIEGQVSGELSVSLNDLTVTGDTILSSLVSAENHSINATVDGQQVVIGTFDANTTKVQEVLNAFINKGFSASIDDNGKISIAKEGVESFSIASSTLADALKISGTATINDNREYNAIQSSGTQTIAGSGTLNEYTTLEDLGLSSGTLGGTINGENLDVKTFDEDATIDEVFDYLRAYGIEAKIEDGKVVASADGVVTISVTSLANKLGLSGTWDATETVVEQIGSSKQITNSEDFNLDTKLSELGLTGEQTISGTINGENLDVKTFDEDATIDEVLDYLRAYGIEAKIEDGKVVASADADVDIYSTNLAETLGIAKAWTKTETVASQQSAAQVYNQTGLKLAEDTLLKDLGYTSATLGGTIDGERMSPLQLNGDSKISDVLDYLQSYGIDASIDSQGRLVASADKAVSISNTSFANYLGIAGDWNYTYNNEVSESKNLTVTTTDSSVIKGSTKLKDIDGVDSYEFNITVDGISSTISLNGDNTVSDVMNALKSAGVESVTISNGVIAAASSKEVVISPTTVTGTNIMTKLGLTGDWESTGCVQSSTENLTKVDENTSTVNIAEDTLLSSIGNVTEGSIYLTVDGVRHTIEIDETGTVGDFLSQLETYGINASVNKDGEIELYYAGEVSLATPTSDASNVLDVLGLNTEFNKLYNNSTNLGQEDEVEVSIDRNTLLADLGVTNNILKYQDGNSIKSIMLSSDETVGSLMDKLVEKGFSASIDSDGKLTIYAEKDMYLIDDTTSETDVTSILGITSPATTYNYNTTLTAETEVNVVVLAGYDSKLSDMGVSEGSVIFDIDGVSTEINVAADDTIASFVQKINIAGLDVSANYDEATGKMSILSTGASSFVMTDGTSNLMSKLGLDTSEFGEKLVSSGPVQGLIAKTVSGVVDADTVLSTFGVKDGTISLYVDGVKSTVEIDSTKTLGQLMEELVSPYNNDITWNVNEYGKMEIRSISGKSLQLGTSADKSNFADIVATKVQADGSLLGSSSLFKANTAAKLTSAEAGFIENITEGTFTIGEAEFTIDENTTLDSLINQINTSEDAHASAYWDSVGAKLVITSKDTGAAYINIEKGDSNFTDVMGFTNGAQLLTDKQILGENAEFSINGTKMTSASNTITSDISKIKGLTFNLKSVSENNEPTKVVVSQDTDSLMTVVKDFVKGYNNLMSNLEKELGAEGGLNDESTLRMLKNELRTLITGSDAGATVFKNLDAIGITTGKATDTLSTNMYTLEINEDKFLDALNQNATAVKELLIGGDSNQGVLTKVSKVVNNSLDAVSGYFATRNKSLDLTLQRIDNNIERQNNAVEKYRSQLENKFQLMDKMIADMQKQYSSFLS